MKNLLIVFAVRNLKKAVENSKIDKALNLLFDIRDSYEQLTIYRKVPGYGNDRILTDAFYRYVNSGVSRYKGGDKGRENRIPKTTPEEAIQAMDEMWKNKPKSWGKTKLREEVGKKFGLSGRQIDRIIGPYTPPK